MSSRVVQRSKDDVEAFEDPIAEIEPLVGQNVDLAAMKNYQLRVTFAQIRNVVGLSLDAVDGQVAAGCRMRRVVGDGDVLVAQSHGSLDHGSDAVPAIRVVGVDVQVATNVAALDERGQRAGLGRAKLVPAVADL